MRHARRSFGGLPLTVLVHDPAYFVPAGMSADMQATLHEIEPIIQSMQGELARQSSSGTLITVPESGHYIQLDQPGAVVAAITEMVSAVR